MWVSSGRLLARVLALALMPALPGVWTLQGAVPVLADRWVYCPVNFLVDAEAERLAGLIRRAAATGYTGVLVADSKFVRLGEMPTNYFRNVERTKALAVELKLEIIPALFGIGYSNDLLWHDPNLVEGLPVTNAPFVIRAGVALPDPDPALPLRGGDMSHLKLWSWKDDAVTGDEGTARITDPKGANARLVQTIRLRPFRQYHFSVRVKTSDFQGMPEVKVLADGRPLNYRHLGVRPTQEWAVHHVVFNSLEHSEAAVYLGCWGGGTGSLWFDDAKLEEGALVNVIRREGTPLVMRRADGSALVEGRDFEPVKDPRLGNQPYKGEFEEWHEPPVLRMRGEWADGTRLFVSYYHAVTVYDGQAMICPSEPRTVELLRDQARRVHAAWGARSYMMSHDEVRVLNWCGACRRRNLSAGQILADNVRTCTGILREVNPGGRILVWSDMFDPYHNAVEHYYLVRGTLAGSWEGLDPAVDIVAWYFERRDRSLKWFSDRGHRQLIAGYYDGPVGQVRDWLRSAGQVSGVTGVMYTTWRRNYADLERFAEAVEAFQGR